MVAQGSNRSGRKACEWNLCLITNVPPRAPLALGNVANLHKRLSMTLKSRLKKLEKLEERCSKMSRSPVHWTAIVDGKLIRVGLGNGTNLAGPEASRALEEAQNKRDPLKVYCFDPNDLLPA